MKPCLTNFDAIRIGNEHRVPVHVVRSIEAALKRDLAAKHAPDEHLFHVKRILPHGFAKPVQLCTKCLVVRHKYRGVFHYYRKAGLGEHMGTKIKCSPWNYK